MSLVREALSRAVEDRRCQLCTVAVHVRNFGDGIGLSWQQAFQTDRREGVEAFCAAERIDFEWKPDGGLRTDDDYHAFDLFTAGNGDTSEFRNKRDTAEYRIDVTGMDVAPRASHVFPLSSENSTTRTPRAVPPETAALQSGRGQARSPLRVPITTARPIRPDQLMDWPPPGA